jgi:hypothetical protein
VGAGLSRGSDDDIELPALMDFSWTGEGTCATRGRGGGRGVGAVPSELDRRLSESIKGEGESGRESCERRGGSGDAALGLDMGGISRRDLSMVPDICVYLLSRSCNCLPRTTS